MNTAAIVTRASSNSFPEWNPGAGGGPGYTSLESSEAVEARRQSSRFRAAFRKYWWVVLVIWGGVAIPSSAIVYMKVPAEYVAKGEVEVAPVSINPVSRTES